MKVSKRFLGVKSSAAPLFAAVALMSAPAFVSCGDDDKEGNVTETQDTAWREEAVKADEVIGLKPRKYRSENPRKVIVYNCTS